MVCWPVLDVAKHNECLRKRVQSGLELFQLVAASAGWWCGLRHCFVGLVRRIICQTQAVDGMEGWG